MANNRKPVADRTRHREKVQRWIEKKERRTAKKVADRLLGKAVAKPAFKEWWRWDGGK